MDASAAPAGGSTGASHRLVVASKGKSPLWRLLTLMKVERRTIVIGAFFQSLQSLTYIPFAASTGWLIDHVINRKAPEFPPLPPEVLAWWLVGFVLANLLLWPFHAGFTVIAFHYSQTLVRATVARMRRLIVDQLQRMSLSYFATRGAGAVSNQVTVDLGRVEGFLGNIANSFLIAQFVGWGTLVYLAYVNPVLLAIALIATPLQIVLMRFMRGRIQTAHNKVQKSGETFGSKIVEFVGGMRHTRSFGNEDMAAAELGRSIEEMRTHGLAAGMVTRWLSMGMQFIFEFLTCIVWCVGGWFAIQGSITLGQLVMFMGLYGYVRGAFGAWIQAYEAWVPAEPGMRALLEIIESSVGRPMTLLLDLHVLGVS